MPSEAILAFDTSGPWCAVAVTAGDQVLAHRHEALARGQGERLFPAIEDALAEAGLAWRDLVAIGVGTGPGNFTGIRIGVAAARGLALGLGVPAVGVTRFEALALDGPDLPALVPAPRGMAWLARPGAAPELVDPAGLAGPVLADPVEFANLLGHDFANPTGDFAKSTAIPPAQPLAVAIARLAGAKAHAPQPRPAPLYLRPADAAPPSDPTPVLLD